MKLSRPLAALAALVLGSGTLWAMDNPLPKLKIDEYRLSNGLTVFLLEDHSAPTVAVNINYMVGSKDEKPGRTGFAHLFEHMMFQASGHRPGLYINAIQEIGGAVNGGTNSDRTRYWEVVPAGYLERALWLEADRMGYLLDALDKERLDNQISVVQNEKRQNYDNRPYGLVREKIAAVLYPDNHPYHWLTIGSMADLSASSVDDVKEFFRAYYTPNNAALCIAGDFDPAAAKALVEKYFGSLPPGPPVSRPGRWTPRLEGETELFIQDRVELARTQIVWATPPIFDADEAALNVFGQILGGGKTSRLYKRLVHELGIAQDVSASNDARQLAGEFQILLVPKPGRTLAEVEREARAVLAEALDKGVSAEELERVRTATMGEFVRSMQSLGTFTGLSDKINEYHHYLGRPDLFRWDLQRYLDLDQRQVVEAARRWLGPNRLVARVEPLGKLAVSKVAAPDRTVAPARAAERPLALPARQRFALPNGLPVILVEHHRAPLVAAALVVKSGAAADPAGRFGLASLTAELLAEGAAGKPGEAIHEEFEALGAEFDANASMDATTVYLSALKPNLVRSLALYGDVVLRPDFPADELRRVKDRRIVRFKQLRAMPEWLAAEAASSVVMGKHPYGHLPLGDAADVGAATQDDVRSFWKSHYTPKNATLIVVGDVTRAEIEPLLAKTFGGWAGGPAPEAAPTAPRPLGGRVVYLVDKPGATQSTVLAAAVGAARKDPAHDALDLANMALGGQFASRINLNLREAKGYTYGARSAFDFRRVPGLFTAGAPVQGKFTAATVKELLADLEASVGPKPLTDQELTLARATAVDGYARRFETAGQIARELFETALYDLPDDAVEAYPESLKKLGAADVNAALKKALDPSRLAIIVVGDAAVVRPELEKLGLGEIKTLELK